jgi:uncharacterized protein YbjT (DUF2867 family)
MILVTGATGNVGKELVPLLLESGARVRVMLRNPTAATHLDARVDCVHGNLDEPHTLCAALHDVRAAYLIAFETRQVENFTTAARAAGVRYIVRQSTQEAGVEPPVGPGRWHRTQEQLIERSDLGWTHIRPTMMTVNTIGWWADTIHKRGEVVFPGGAGLVAPIDPKDIAAVACATLTGTGHEGRAYEVTGPDLLSGAGMAQVLARVLNTRIKYVDVPETATGDWLTQFGFSPSLMAALAETLGNLRSNRFAYVTDTVERLTGRTPRRFEEWCGANVAAFRRL